MRIIQIIDSLEAGGAERMAVNYANALAYKIEFSGLVATRKEGTLLNQIHLDVAYLFLNKKSKIDFSALFRLRSFIVKNEVTHIHAHSTSFFLAFLLKLICPTLKLIWHNHYGNSEFLPKSKLLVLRIITPFFDGIIAVNQNLKKWAEQKLHFKKTVYLPNFSTKEIKTHHPTFLKGIEGKRIVLLANLREEKNHFLLLEVAQQLKQSHSDWTFHLIGKDFEDEYAFEIKRSVSNYKLENHVFLYGSQEDIGNILHQASIAVLTSKFEGLPVALLEYGLYKKAIVVTSVGEIPTIVLHGQNGFVVNPDQSEVFYQFLVKLIDNEVLRVTFGETLFDTIQTGYIAESVMGKYLNWLHQLK